MAHVSEAYDKLETEVWYMVHSEVTQGDIIHIWYMITYGLKV